MADAFTKLNRDAFDRHQLEAQANRERLAASVDALQQRDAAVRSAMGPLYDCGSRSCSSCQRAFGPDRSHAFAQRERRAALYAELERKQREAV